MSQEQDLEKDRHGVLVQLTAEGILVQEVAKICFCMENRGFRSFPSFKPWDLMSHTTPGLPLIFNPPPSPFLPTSRRLQRGPALPVTHPGWGRSSPRGRGGTGACWAPRAGAGRTPRAACWPRRRAAAGAGAPRPPTAPPRTRGSQCPGRCCGTGEAFAVLFLQPPFIPGGLAERWEQASRAGSRFRLLG